MLLCYVHIYINLRSGTQIYTYVHTYINLRSWWYIWCRRYTYIHTYIYTYIHTYIHTHTYTHRERDIQNTAHSTRGRPARFLQDQSEWVGLVQQTNLAYKKKHITDTYFLKTSATLTFWLRDCSRISKYTTVR